MLCGGQPAGPQVRSIRRGAQIIVGTPGRTLDMLNRGVLSFKGLDRIVLDEADEMLQMGFIEDIETILGFIPDDRPHQTALFSATLSAGVRRIAQKHLKNPKDARVDPDARAAAGVIQQVIMVREQDKLRALDRVLEVEAGGVALVFVRTRLACAELANSLADLGHAVAPMHGDMSQANREAVLHRFRKGWIRVLVATDVAARGLDVEEITHVINFDLPDSPDVYVHRVGRTGRAGRSGIAISLVQPRERRKVEDIERHVKQRLPLRTVPNAAEVIEGRSREFEEHLIKAIAEAKGLDAYKALVQRMVEAGTDAQTLAATALHMATGRRPLDLKPESAADIAATPFWLPTGTRFGVRARDIMGALTNDVGLPESAIGAIDVMGGNTEVWIATTHADQLGDLHELWLRGRRTRFNRVDGEGRRGSPSPKNGGQGRPWKGNRKPQGRFNRGR
ncbi:MAG: ATP-dependent RNA helicase DeaD [Bradymonadia bacterium]